MPTSAVVFETMSIKTPGVVSARSKCPATTTTMMSLRPPDYVVWRNGLGTTYTRADCDVWCATSAKPLAAARVP